MDQEIPLLSTSPSGGETMLPFKTWAQIKALAANMLYDAWGNVRANDGEVQGKYRYTGAEQDTTTGLDHMGARFYDPTVGRWLSEDPVQDQHFEPDSLNFYAYVFNNPVLLTDPLGTDPPPYPSGPTPEGIQEAAQRLQDFIDALIALNELIEAMRSRGITSITIAGLQVSLASLQQAANFLSSRAAAILYFGIEETIRRHTYLGPM